MKPEVFIKSNCINAEGPVWDDRTQTFYFIDVEAGKIFSYKDEKLTVWEAGEKVGFAVLSEEGGVIAGLQSGFCAVDFPDGGFKVLADPEKDLPGNRFNDGKADPFGHLFGGTLTMTRPDGAEGPLAALYRLDKKAEGYEAVKVIDKVGLSNGLAWNADRTKMYFVDTDFGTVAEYAYDPANGELGEGRVIIQVPSEMGFPDGMSIDENGKLWVALWNGGAISQWDPETGELLQNIDLPVKNVSSCCFGGPDMDILFITTASQDTDTSVYPLAGNVFCMKPGVKGEKSYRAAI